MSAEASSLVNEAFGTLKSPLKRGEYLASPPPSLLSLKRLHSDAGFNKLFVLHKIEIAAL